MRASDYQITGLHKTGSAMLITKGAAEESVAPFGLGA